MSTIARTAVEPFDESKMHAFVGKMIGDIGATLPARSSSSAIDSGCTARWPNTAR